MKVSRDLSTINRNQKYFRTRENRNFSTVKSTESRIFNFSVVESGLMVCMAGLQVFIVRFFFQGARKGEFRDTLIWGLEGLLTWVRRVCMNMGMVHWRVRGLLYMDIFCRFQYPVLGCGSATPDQITALCSGSDLQRCCSGHPLKAPWHSKIATYPGSAIYHQIYTNLSTTLLYTQRLQHINSYIFPLTSHTFP